MDLTNRKRLRLEDYNYSGQGTYFLTLCSIDKTCLFSRIVGDGVLDVAQLQLSIYGQMIQDTFQEMDRLYQNLRIDKYVIMPNHVHLLVTLLPADGTSGRPSPTNATIQSFVGTLKRFVNRRSGRQMFQRSYYDHIVRDEKDYLARWKYIDDNPIKWQEDCLYVCR